MATLVKNKTGLLTDDIKRVKQERQRRLKRSRFRKMGELREKDIGFASFVSYLVQLIILLHVVFSMKRIKFTSLLRIFAYKRESTDRVCAIKFLNEQ